MKRSAREKGLTELAATLAGVADSAEMYAFLYGILTPRERRTIALRWELVKLLERGMSQRAICAKLGVSLCKVTRGSRELKRGLPGFGKVVRRAARRTSGCRQGGG